MVTKKLLVAHYSINFHGYYEQDKWGDKLQVSEHDRDGQGQLEYSLCEVGHSGSGALTESCSRPTHLTHW
jgi:hypothetical protein